jgi:Tn3 transposase DDE domain
VSSPNFSEVEVFDQKPGAEGHAYAQCDPGSGRVLDRRGLLDVPQVRITDLLLEVDRWTSFTQHFTHLNGDERSKDTPLL